MAHLFDISKPFVLFSFLWHGLNAQTDTFKFCGYGVSFDECTEYCEQLRNDGSTNLCDSYDSFQPCFCFDNYEQCYGSSFCPQDDVCVKLLPYSNLSFCVPCSTIPYRSPLPIFVDSYHECIIPSPPPVPYESPIIRDDFFQPCKDSSDCLYYCSLLKNDGVLDACWSDDEGCICTTNDVCSSSDDCAFGEACVKLTTNANFTYCVSCNAIRLQIPSPMSVDSKHACDGGDLEYLLIPSNPIATVSSAPQTIAAITSTQYPAIISGPAATSPITNGPSQVLESPPTFTSNPTSSFTLTFVSLSVSPSPMSYSSAPIPTSESRPPEDRHCVAVDHIRYLPQSELVYHENHRAVVLCDSKSNCATPGHMVVYNDVPMMMKNYCNQHVLRNCKRREAVVNSPRMRRGIRLLSNSRGLELTALAALYETTFEERLLRALLRNGW